MNKEMLWSETNVSSPSINSQENESNKSDNNKSIYTYALTDIEQEIDKYYDNVNDLWETVILEYKNNPGYGIILNKLSFHDKTKFYDMMSHTPVIKMLMESRRRLLLITGKK